MEQIDNRGIKARKREGRGPLNFFLKEGKIKRVKAKEKQTPIRESREARKKLFLFALQCSLVSISSPILSLRGR